MTYDRESVSDTFHSRHEIQLSVAAAGDWKLNDLSVAC